MDKRLSTAHAWLPDARAWDWGCERRRPMNPHAERLSFRLDWPRIEQLGRMLVEHMRILRTRSCTGEFGEETGVGILRSGLLMASENDWLKSRLPRYRFVRRAVKRFMPGEEAEAALSEAASLEDTGLGTVISILGENVEDRSDSLAAASDYRELLKAIQARGLKSEISLKLTHLGLDFGQSEAKSNLESVAAVAAQTGNVVWVDMEGSAYTDRTLQVFRGLRQRYSNTGLCLQAALLRTPEDLESLMETGPAIRLVKGAYSEPANIAYPKKSDVDEHFFRLAQRLLRGDALSWGVRPAFATHDSRLIEAIAEEADKSGVDRSTFEFQMLYGIRSNLQRQLARDGYRVLITIAFGSAWFPWYMRRLAERPANVWFVLKNLAGS